MKNFKTYARLLVLGFCLACLPNSAVTRPELLPAGMVRVLFIGNSLTYTNNLPSLVLALARAAGDTLLVAHQIAYPDYALEDHWNQGAARNALQSNKYEFVVMQQGSSALPASQIHLDTWTKQFAPLISAAGATPMLFMVWPQSNRLFDFPNVRDSYRNAAAGVHGIFAPAGDAWVASTEANTGIALYSPDGLHPTLAGTYVSAVVILQRLRGIEPEQLPNNIPGVSSFPSADVLKLQHAARVALDRNPARP